MLHLIKKFQNEYFHVTSNSVKRGMGSCQMFHSFITAGQSETEPPADQKWKLRDFYYFNMNKFISESVNSHIPPFLCLAVFMVNMNKQSVKSFADVLSRVCSWEEPWADGHQKQTQSWDLIPKLPLDLLWSSFLLQRRRQADVCRCADCTFSCFSRNNRLRTT